MNIPIEKIYLLIINVLGGIAVLGSYAYGINTHPDAGKILWGNVPLQLKTFYNISMLSAAAGYFLFTYFIMFSLNPGDVKIAGRLSYNFFLWIYAVILIFSAFWMPLTFYMNDNPSMFIWILIRIVLLTVGFGSLFLFAALIYVEPQMQLWPHRAALVGAAAFCLQTAILDALVWTYYYPVKG
jgi:hypothetical protein